MNTQHYDFGKAQRNIVDFAASTRGGCGVPSRMLRDTFAVEILLAGVPIEKGVQSAWQLCRNKRRR